MSRLARNLFLALIFLPFGGLFAQTFPGDFIEERDLEKKRIPRFRFDYGMQFLVMNQTQNLVTNDPLADQDWLFKSPGHQLSLSMLPGYRENWTIGVSFYYHRLLKEQEDLADLMPADQFPYGYYENEIQFRRSVRVFGNSLLVERRLFSTPMEEFRVFARGELGYLRYKAKARIGQDQQMDSTSSFEVFSKAEEVSSVFSGTLGLGIQYQKDFIGVNLLAGYRMETAHSFLPRNQFNEWKAEYYQQNYDGYPSDDEFGIKRDNIPDNKHRFSQLYIQLSVLFFIGEPWK